MICQQCSYALSPFDTVCPRCGLGAGQPPPNMPPVQPQAPPPPAYQQPVQPPPMSDPQRAVQAGFFGFIGVWLASILGSCAIPVVGCGGCALVLLLMALFGAMMRH